MIPFSSRAEVVNETSAATECRRIAALSRGERLQLVARDFAEVLQWIDPRAALGHFVQLADRPVRREVGADCCVHDLLGARNSSWQGRDAHPADQAVEGDELLHLWLVAQDRTTIRFRCYDDEILVEVVSPRHFGGRRPNPCLST